MTPPPADRAGLEAQQAELLRALIRGDGFPADFDARKVAAAGRALRRKRARMVARAWPALAVGLGVQFAARFDAFARTTSPPAAGFGYTDGLVFARSLGDDELTDDIRVELLLARAAVAGRAGAPRRRRGLFVGVVTLHVPRRLVVVLRVPSAGRRMLVVPLARER